MYTLRLTCNEYIYSMQYYFTRFQNHESVAIFFILVYFIYIAEQHVLKTFSSVNIMTRILARLTRLARTVTRMTRMTRMARWLAH